VGCVSDQATQPPVAEELRYADLWLRNQTQSLYEEIVRAPREAAALRRLQVRRSEALNMARALLAQFHEHSDTYAFGQLEKSRDRLEGWEIGIAIMERARHDEHGHLWLGHGQAPVSGATVSAHELLYDLPDRSLAGLFERLTITNTGFDDSSADRFRQTRTALHEAGFAQMEARVATVWQTLERCAVTGEAAEVALALGCCAHYMLIIRAFQERARLDA
jgi:hypothetical protein